ncbi:HAUS augmin-like complex subunit 3 [Tripterygium wilfordii]|uniref:HAUS augmin-like complex subunit 3 n=1 Tax=Tripterygium wilfordii TaxID=458696 RepID=A0A7J7DIY9_TRIWF|nr:HAUS augmin-like complex subunit 3 [Tripterygium wilfordii]
MKGQRHWIRTVLSGLSSMTRRAPSLAGSAPAFVPQISSLSPSSPRYLYSIWTTWPCLSYNVNICSRMVFICLYEQFLQEGKLLEGEDLDFAYDSISAFSTRRDHQEAVFGAEEGLKDIRDATLAYKAEALELQRELRHLLTCSQARLQL